jgi:hypothetical protein
VRSEQAPQDQEGHQSKEQAEEEPAGEKFAHVVGIEAKSEKNPRE